MSVISANELKVKGISALDSLISTEVVSITVRGVPKYYVINTEQYQYLRECELIAALMQSNQDIAEGKFAVESVDAHMAKLKAL